VVKEFLTDRSQKAIVNGKHNDLTSGAPEGTVLTPFMLLYINDYLIMILPYYLPSDYMLMMFYCMTLSIHWKTAKDFNKTYTHLKNGQPHANIKCEF